MYRIVPARDVKDGVVLPLVLKSSDMMAYVKMECKYHDARRLEALPNHCPVHRSRFGGRSRAMVCEAWGICQEK